VLLHTEDYTSVLFSQFHFTISKFCVAILSPLNDVKHLHLLSADLKIAINSSELGEWYGNDVSDTIWLSHPFGTIIKYIYPTTSSVIIISVNVRSGHVSSGIFSVVC